MPTARLYLIRHAQAVGFDTHDPLLSEMGRSQARALGARLAKIGVAGILHSPRPRAKNTAELVAHSLSDVPVDVSNLLDDRTPVPSPQRRSDYPLKYWDWLAATPTSEQDIDGLQITSACTQLADMARAAANEGPLILHRGRRAPRGLQRHWTPRGPVADGTLRATAAHAATGSVR